MNVKRRPVLAATIGLAVIGASAAVALGSPGSEIVATSLVAKAQLNQEAHVNSDGVKFRTKVQTDIAVQTITFSPGGRTGWHHHPGFVLVAVRSGEVTVLDADCDSKTYGPDSPDGAAFIESGDQPLEVRNNSSAPATVYATLVAPDANPPVFRTENEAVPCP